jgi:AAA domain
VACSGGPRTLVLECDRGTETAAFAGFKPKRWKIQTWDDMTDAFMYLANGGTSDFDWVWIDSFTGFQERGLDDIMDELVSVRSHRKKWLPDRGDYGANMNRLTLLLRDFRELPINIGITCHVLRVEDEDDGTVTNMPYVQGKNMPEKVCAYFAVVAVMDKYEKDDKEVFRLRAGTVPKWYTKDRFRLGTILNPTLPKIMERVEAARSGVARPPVRRTTKRAS